MIEEQYTAPTANQILGITLRAKPRGVPPTPFMLDSLTSGFARWSNPHHDFPQRIQYTRPHRDTLVATIEGPSGNGLVRSSEWMLGRVKCAE